MSHKNKFSTMSHSQCNFKKSELFCTIGTGGIINLGVGDFRKNIATLKICQENCSEVLHNVCAVASTAFETGLNPELETLIFNITFRIIDEFGKIVCEKTYNISRNVTIPARPPSRIVTIDFPICFDCCDILHQCACNTTYRLDVSSSIPLLIRDVTWAAIVWEN
jgi:hypothetical protein